MNPFRPARLVAVLVLLLSAGAAAPQGAAAATTCSFNDATNTLTVTGDPEVGSAVAVNPSDEINVLHTHALGEGTIDCSGPTPTTANTDLVSVNHTSPDEDTRVRINNAAEFAGGTINEVSLGGLPCPGEVEIEIDVGFGADVVWLLNSEGTDDAFAVDNEGVNWNTQEARACEDRDISFEHSYDIKVTDNGGTNFFTAQRSLLLNPDPLTAELTYFGGPGKDRVIGGDGADLLTGGGRKDELYGKKGNDGLFAEDGKKDTVLDCGPGPKLSEFAVRDSKDPRARSC